MGSPATMDIYITVATFISQRTLRKRNWEDYKSPNTKKSALKHCLLEMAA